MFPAYVDTKTRQKIRQVIISFDKAYQKKVEHIMDNNSDSFFIKPVYNDLYLIDKNEPEYIEQRFLKDEFIPTFSDVKIKELFSRYLTKEEWVYAQETINREFSPYLKKEIKRFNKIMGVPYPHIFNYIKNSPFYWFRFNNNSNEHSFINEENTLNVNDTMKILDCISNINDLLGNTKFHAVPLSCSNQNGRSYNLFDNNKKIKQSIYCSENKKYIELESNEFILDANIGLMFFYKNKPCFLVSFFVDRNKNVYFRQIQGQYKARGFKAIGDKWQKQVINNLIKKFEFANEFYIIDGNSMKTYIEEQYADCYYPPVHDALFDKIKNTYDSFIDFNNNFKKIKVSLRNGAKPIVEEYYYQIN